MAKDVLSCPISSVGIERVFSLARQVCTWDRAQLEPKSVEQVMLLKYYNRTMDLDPDEALVEPWDILRREEDLDRGFRGGEDPFRVQLVEVLRQIG